jgi:hypothetical protein
VSDEEIRALLERVEALDKFAVATAKRLDKHVTASAAVHRELRSKLKSLKLLFESLARPHRPPS